MRIIVHHSQDLTALLRDHRERGTRFLLLPGVHDVLGVWAFPDWIVLAPGCSLRGSGRRVTTLRLAAGAVRDWQGAPQGDRSLNPLWVGEGCTIEDLDIDGQEEAFRHGAPDKRWFVASGIRARGGRLTVRRVGICGLRGDYYPTGTQARQIEAFGISTFEDCAGGNLIEDVEFYGIPADAYFSAVYIGSEVGPNGETPARSYVRRIRSHVGTGNWLGVAAGVNVEFEDVVLSGHQIGFYNDTGETRDVLVRRMVASGVRKALSMVAKAPAPQRSVVLEDSEFTFISFAGTKEVGPHVAEIWDQTGSTEMGDVTFRRCRFGPGEGAGPFLWAIACEKLRELRFEDCTLPEKLRKSYGPGTPTNRVVVRGALTPTGTAFSPKIT